MASSQAPRVDRVFHQDYIARIRYSNALPPPAIPPKLLDIPDRGLSSGQYTSASFAARLAREQPLNIEADAELGMPIDLVGIPGVLEGNETAIYPSPHPEIHAKDRALLRPLASLGKSNSSSSGVSFLRRTEYITTTVHQSSTGGSRADPMRAGRNAGQRPRKRRFDANKEEPLQIAKGIVKGFDLAHPADAYQGLDDGTNIRGADISKAEREAWANPKHPKKPDVQLIDAYPFLPDWDALPQPQSNIPAAYATFKFLANPVGSKMQDRYDERLDVAILKQNELSKEESEKFHAREQAWAADPDKNRRYMPKASYVFYLPDESVPVRGIKRKFDVLDPDKDDDALYGGADDDDDLGLGDDKTAFRFNNIRTYETFQQQANCEDIFEHVALSLHDPDPRDDNDRKAAYFYPVMQRSHVRQKTKIINPMTLAPVATVEDDDERVDAFDVRVREMDEDEADAVRACKDLYDEAA